MALFKVSVFYVLLQITAILIGVNGYCQLQNGTVPAVPNGLRSNTDNLTVYTDGTAVGFYDVACNRGFALDSNIGGRITCLDSGNWSDPLPRCKSLGSCPIPVLFDYIKTGEGLKLNQSQSFIYTDGVDDTKALGGSNITLECREGFANLGGSFTIACTEDDTWTPFPKCVSTSTATTTKAPVRCPYSNDTFNFADGYISKGDDLLLYSDQTAEGSLVVSCSSGYVIDSVTHGILTCNEGVWSQRPSCSKTGRCSLQTIQKFLDDTAQTQCTRIVSQDISVEKNDDTAILQGSTISFACKDGCSNASGNLNVSCNEKGQWDQFPSCVADPTTTTAL